MRYSFDLPTLFAIFLGIVALVFAIKQFRDAQRQTRKLEAMIIDLTEQSKTLIDVKGSLSTRYLGVFPDYIPDITEFISRTKKNLTIFCDFPAYGAFSDYDKFLDYSHALQKISNSNDKSLELTCLHREERAKILDRQFKPNDDKEWEQWKNDLTNRKKIEKFLKMYSSMVNSETVTPHITFGQFKKCLQRCNSSILTNIFQNKNMEVKGTMPLYFWIRDDIGQQPMEAEAVLAIPSFVNNETEFGFITSDHILIKALRAMYNSYEKYNKAVRNVKSIPNNSKAPSNLQVVGGMK